MSTEDRINRLLDSLEDPGLTEQEIKKIQLKLQVLRESKQ